MLAPDVLLLDEPLSALDPQLRKQVRAELKDLQRRVGVTFLFVTHDQEEALSMSDRIAVMNGGQVEQVGTPQEMYQRPRTKFVASFLGAMNWIDGIGVRPECTRISRERGKRRAAGGGHAVRVSGPGDSCGGAAGGRENDGRADCARMGADSRKAKRFTYGGTRATNCGFRDEAAAGDLSRAAAVLMR